jgi:hypothetical protein
VPGIGVAEQPRSRRRSRRTLAVANAGPSSAPYPAYASSTDDGVGSQCCISALTPIRRRPIVVAAARSCPPRRRRPPRSCRPATRTCRTSRRRWPSGRWPRRSELRSGRSGCSTTRSGSIARCSCSAIACSAWCASSSWWWSCARSSARPVCPAMLVSRSRVFASSQPLLGDARNSAPIGRPEAARSGSVAIVSIAGSWLAASTTSGNRSRISSRPAQDHRLVGPDRDRAGQVGIDRDVLVAPRPRRASATGRSPAAGHLAGR